MWGLKKTPDETRILLAAYRMALGLSVKEIFPSCVSSEIDSSEESYAIYITIRLEDSLPATDRCQ